jgi:alpha-tubulin suppressor-like RCC1 family protein
MKLRRTLFAALVVGAIFPGVPASAASLTETTLTVPPVITTKFPTEGLAITAEVTTPGVTPTAPKVPLPGMQVEIVVGSAKKTGVTGADGTYKALFQSTDFTDGLPVGPTNVRATTLGALSAVSAANTTITSIADATALFDTIDPPSGLVRQIDSGAAHTCILATDRGVRCWGEGAMGQLGNGPSVGAAVDSTRAVSVATASGALSDARALAVGTNHACVITATEAQIDTSTGGDVYCWGSNSRGQLGTQTSGQVSNVAVRATRLTEPAVALAAGTEHTCAITVSSRITCWGRPNASFLGFEEENSDGVGEVILVDSPVKIPLSGAIDVTAGQSHTCATVRGGSVYCWGDPSFNRTGPATTTKNVLPRIVPGVTAVALEAGRAHTCAATDSGVKCWGFNLNGQLGRGDTTTSVGDVPGITEAPKAMALGTSHSCFVTSSATLCAGRNDSGVFGTGNTTSVATATAVTNASGSITATAGDDHTCFVGPASAAIVRCTGIASDGRLGNGLTTPNVTAPVFTEGLNFAAKLAAGKSHTCALLAGTAGIRCWGENEDGQVGNDTTVDALSPVAITGPANTYAIEAGDAHTCLLAGTPGDNTGDALSCWGRNDEGQIGTGTGDQLKPILVPGISPISVTLGGNHTCALLPAAANQRKSVRCWGKNDKGQLGDGTVVNKTTPTTVLGLTGSQAADIVSLDAGFDHTCAVMDTGAVKCWGNNATGQLGLTSPSSTHTPMDSPFVANAETVTAGSGFTCLTDTDDEIQCFGTNSDFQLGYEGPDSEFPVLKAAGVAKATSVESGGSHSCSMAPGSFKLSCWGRNDESQLGVTGGSKAGEVFPLGSTVMADTALGGSHTCALQRDTILKCWGSNTSGQLGNGSTVAATAPISIALT